LNFKRKSHEVYYADPALFYGNDHHDIPRQAAIPIQNKYIKKHIKGTHRANWAVTTAVKSVIHPKGQGV
jgi:hypothetical protein